MHSPIIKILLPLMFVVGLVFTLFYGPYLFYYGLLFIEVVATLIFLEVMWRLVMGKNFAYPFSKAFLGAVVGMISGYALSMGLVPQIIRTADARDYFPLYLGIGVITLIATFLLKSLPIEKKTFWITTLLFILATIILATLGILNF